MKQPSRRNSRVLRHLDLVNPMARRYASISGLDGDDLRQVGALGLLRAAERYEASRDVPFAVFARPHIRGAILHYLRDGAALVRLPRRVQQSANDSAPSWNAASQRRRLLPIDPEWPGAPEPAVEGLEVTERQVRAIEGLKTLPAEERQALTLVILNGLSLRGAAGRLDVSAMTVQRRLKRGLKQLRRLLSDQDSLA